GFAWSQTISANTLESTVKSLALQVRKAVQTPDKFKGGGYHDARRTFSVLAVLFAIIAEYDDKGRWKPDAGTVRDLLARAGVDCKVGTDGSFREARQFKDDLDRLLRGEAPESKPGEEHSGLKNIDSRP